MSSVKQTSKRCLILSQGPVPTPEHIKVEGGGLRCWGLAQGLKANNPNISLTVAYHESYRQENFTSEYESIKIKTWNIDSVAEILKEYDTVIVSYCMGDLSVTVVDSIGPDQQLVLDCNVPIYVEASARQSDDIEREYAAFNQEVGRFAHVLRRGDVFLCASDEQKKYYKGVLSALGRINPVTYDHELIIITPYGIYREEPKPQSKPITKTVGKNVKKILWFGGIYPWFDLKNLVDAVYEVNKTVPSKLIIVGAKNPFNTHHDIVRKYDELVMYVDSHPELKDVVVMKDWVRFEDRADWYLDSDLVVLINKVGDENELAWRTRLVDFMWAKLPIITNGGDPLGEYLIERRAAARIIDLEAPALAKEMITVLADDIKLKEMRHNLGNLRREFYWDTVTKRLADFIQQHRRSVDLEKFGLIDSAPVMGSSPRKKIRKVVSKARMMPAYARKYGKRNTYYAVRTTLSNQVNKVQRKIGKGLERSPKVLFVAHQLDMSGAPFVFLDLTEEFVRKHPNVPIEFHTFNPAHASNIIRLNKMGIKPKIHLSKEVGMQFTKGDVLVLNTTAHSQIFKNATYEALENGTLNKLIWFSHEDEPELQFTSSEKKRIQQLLSKDKINFFAAAAQTINHYQTFFENTANIWLQPYQLFTPERFHKVRKANEFDKLSFVLPGTMGDGRKGQLPIFYAFQAFLEQYYKQNPKAYRDFELVYVGIWKDFLSHQLLNHASSLGNHFKHYGTVTHERCLEIMYKSNVTICYSLRECLPLFVYEGMIAGHPILRNDSSGMEEQLIEGKNGYLLDSKDFSQVVTTIERVLNRQKTSNKTLAKMSVESYKISKDLENESYKPIVEDILRSYNT